MAVGLRIGRYQLGERLGTGGFGVVYHALDTELGRELAIKVLRPEYQTQPDVIARFLKEARAAAKIDHPGIITVFECGTISGSGTAQDGNAYIAMELLRGHSLTQHLERKGRMAPADAILIARQVAAALQVAHAAGIVHRDLKPDNVFLLPDPLVKGGFRIKILDFGVAKLFEPKEVGVNTHSQMMLGTPKYMSPEQARSARAVDARTDIYTLGCMLYEMVTAQPPYEGPGAIDLIIQHTTAPIPSPAEIVQNLPPSLDQLIRSMLGKEPEDRPESMKVLDKTLEHIQLELEPRQKPPTAPPPIPRAPARPTPAPPSRPSGLTPTPAAILQSPPTIADSGDLELPTPPRMAVQPALPPMRPTPQPPPTYPSGTVAEPSPLPVARPFPIDDEERTSREEPTTRQRSRAPLFLGVGIAAALAAAAIVWFLLRPKPASDTHASTKSVDAAVVNAPHDEKLETDCANYAHVELWKELADCAEHLKTSNPELAKQYAQTAEDEAANQLKYKGLLEDVKKGPDGIRRARDLMKRMGDKSVYSAKAKKAVEEAEAAASPN